MAWITDMFSIKSIKVSLKATGVSIVFMLAWFVYHSLTVLTSKVTTEVATFVTAAFGLVAWFLWGYLANKIWGWD